MVDFASAFGGLAQGLGEGFKSGTDIAQNYQKLRQQQELVEIQKSELKLKGIGVIDNMRKWSPEYRAQFGAPFLKQIGASIGVEIGPTAMAAFVKGDQDTVNAMADYMAKELNGGKALADIFKSLNDPEKIAEWGAKLSQMRTSKASVGIAAGNLALAQKKFELDKEEHVIKKSEAAQRTAYGLHKDVLSYYDNSLDPEKRPDFAAALAKDKGYSMAARMGNREVMDERASAVIDKNPQWLVQNERMKKIKAVREGNPNISMADAAAIIDGTKTIKPNPVTGNIELIDQRDGTVKEIPRGEGKPAASITEPEGPSIYKSAEEGRIAGAGSALTDIWSRYGQQALSPLGINATGPESRKTLEARQSVQAATQDLARAMQNNPRAFGEMKMILKQLDIDPSVFDSSVALTSRLKSIDKTMRNRLADMERAADNQNLPQAARGESREGAEAIKNFLRKLGVPGSNVPPGSEKIGFNKRTGHWIWKAPNGVSIEDKY